MKVLLIHNQYQQKGGEDTVFLQEAELLASKGNEVRSLTFSNDAISGISGLIKTGTTLLYNKSSEKEIDQAITEFKPDVIHVHNFFPVVSPSVFYLAKSKRIPIVSTLHNYRLVCPGAFLYKDGKVCEACVKKTFPLQGVISKCYRASMPQTLALSVMTSVHKILGTWKNKVDQYIALSEFSKQKFLNSSLGLSESQLSVKGNFVFDNGYSFEKDNYFLYVGRLSREKGIEVLLKGFKNSEHKLRIIGTGPLEEEVKAAASQNPNISYYGYQQHQVIIKELKGAMALIFPSEWFETFGMVVIEAFSTGTPVIASNLGPLPELVKNNSTGLLFNPGDANDLAEKLNIIAKEVTQNRLGKNARETFLSKYNPETNYQTLIGIYQKAITSLRK